MLEYCWSNIMARTTGPLTAFEVTPGLRFGTVRLRTGTLMHYAEHGDAAGAPILLLHGYTDSWYSFSRLLPLLAVGGYHLFAVDQRGHGCSDRPTGDHTTGGYTMDDLADDAVAFLDAAGICRATLVGHSMGTLVARRVAARFPERVERLVLIGAVLGANRTLRELQDAAHALGDPVPDAFVREFQASTVHAPVPEAFFEGVVAESLSLPARVWHAAIDGIVAMDDHDDLGRISMPTLLIWGEHDAVVSRREQEHLEADLVNARLMVYPETGHTPHWERPADVARDLAAFLPGV
jgi:pimeloyl-ACP methyl ester carboxylesterase